MRDVRDDDEPREGVEDWRTCHVCRDFAANVGIGENERWHPDCYIHQHERDE